MLNGTDEVGSAEGVVDDEGNVVAVGYDSDGLDVGDVGVGIAEGLGVYDFCVGTDGGLKCLQVVHIDDGVGDALGGQCVADEVE